LFFPFLASGAAGGEISGSKGFGVGIPTWEVVGGAGDERRGKGCSLKKGSA